MGETSVTNLLKLYGLKKGHKMYLTPILNPILGQIARGGQINTIRSLEKYQYLPCEDCGKLRWSHIYKGVPKRYCRSCAKKGERSGAWKGVNAGFVPIHLKLNRDLGKANHCEFNSLHISTTFHWANKNHSISRNPNDYISLCAKCHTKFDSDYRMSQGKGKLTNDQVKEIRLSSENNYKLGIKYGVSNQYICSIKNNKYRTDSSM